MGVDTYEYYYRGIYSKGSRVDLGLVRYLNRTRRIPRTILHYRNGKEFTIMSDTRKQILGFTRHRLKAKAQYMIYGGVFNG